MPPLSPASEAVDSTTTDLGPLAWVFDELRKSLDSAQKALKRYAQESQSSRESDLGAADSAPLRIARSQLHQVVGALDMVGFQAPATVVRAMEAAVQRFLAKPQLCTDSALSKMEKAGFALVDYLETVLNNKPVSPVALFAQYRDVQELAAAQRIHPADLWTSPPRAASVPWPTGQQVQPLRPGAEVRALFDRYVLHVMKSQHPVAAAHLKQAAAGLASGSELEAQRVFWCVAAAYFEGVQHGLLPSDVYVKRAASRVLVQYTAQAQGGQDVSSSVLHDLLFFAAQARVPAEVPTPWLDAVRQAHGLTTSQPVAYESPSLGRFDPALLAQARKRTQNAKEGWTLLTGGDTAKARQVHDQFGLVLESLKKILPEAVSLGTALVQAAAPQGAEPALPSAELGLEVATAVLYLEAVMQDMDPDHPDLGARMDTMAQRVLAAKAGQASPPLEPWMEDLYRRVSDRHTMGSVVGELKISLAELERALDQFARDPAQQAPLVPVPQQLTQMRGVLSVLGLDHAAQAVAHMRTNVEGLLADEIDTARAQEAGTFSRLANNLSALSFLIDMLNYQPVLARKLFVFDTELGELQPLMGRVAAPQGQSVPADAPLPEPLTHEPEAPASVAPAEPVTLSPAADTVPQVLAVEPPAPEVIPPEIAELAHAAPTQAPEPLAASVAPPAVVQADEVEDDLLDIFLEEARDVILAGESALENLVTAPSSMPDLTTLRRAFHTLKGSSRMVGLSVFGDAAWALEQVMNAWLAEAKPANDALRGLCVESLQALARWVDDISHHRAGQWAAEPFQRSAEALRLRGERLPLSAHAGAVAPPNHAEDLSNGSEGVALHTVEADSADILTPELPPDPEQAPEPELSAEVEPVSVAPIADAEPADVPLLAVPPLPTDESVPEVSEGVEVQDGLPDIDFDSLFNDVPSPSAEPLGVPTPADTAPATLDNADEAATAQVFDEAPPPAEPTATAVDDLEFDWSFDDAPPVDLGGAVSAQGPGLVVPNQSPDSGNDWDWVGDAPALPVAQDAPLPDALPPDDLPLDALPPGPAVPTELAGLEEALWSEPAEPVAEDFALDFGEPSAVAPTVDSTSTPEEAAPEPEEIDLAETPGAEDDVKRIGHLRVGARLFNVFLNEADDWSHRLSAELCAWAAHPAATPVPDTCAALAHSLAGASAAVGFAELAELARALEHALNASLAHALQGQAAQPDDAQLFTEAADDIRRLLHQFAAGFLKSPQQGLVDALAAFERRVPAEPEFEPEGLDVDLLQWPEPEPEPEPSPEPKPTAPEPALSAEPESQPEPAAEPEQVFGVSPTEASEAESVSEEATATPETGRIAYVDDDIDEVDTLDADLFQIFEEEAQELLPQLGAALRQWVSKPRDAAARNDVLRTLHTLKGSARLSGALRLGEMAHRLETQAERLGSDVSDGRLIDPLVSAFDDLVGRFEALRLPAETAVAHRVTAQPEGLAQVVQTLLPVAQPDAQVPHAATPEPQAQAPEPVGAPLQNLDAALPAAVLPSPIIKGAAGAGRSAGPAGQSNR